MFRNEFKNALIAVSLTLLSGPVVFAETPATVTQENPTNDDRRAAYLAHQVELNNIQANRPSIIKAIVNTWAKESSGNANTLWEDEITAALNNASNEDLFNIQNAETYDEVLGVLRGDLHVLGGSQPSLSVSAANDAIAPVSVEDTPTDLVFTPAFPCRIYDNRFTGSYGGTGIDAQDIRSYIVYSNTPSEIAQIKAQGGNPDGCPAPYGEPSAISGNFTVVPGGANEGWITAFPYGGTLPNSSLVNYYANRNIANAAIIATAYLHPDAYDISVYHRHNIYSLADVMGYFYPATPAADFAYGNPGGLVGDGKVHSFGYSVQMTITTNNQKIFWTAHQPVGTVSGASGLDIYPCWKASAATSWVTAGLGSFGITMTGIQRNMVSESAVVAPGIGVYDFGLCYKTNNTNWTFNEWGYVAAQRN